LHQISFILHFRRCLAATKKLMLNHPGSNSVAKMLDHRSKNIEKLAMAMINMAH
jgi:hypothetical protein